MTDKTPVPPMPAAAATPAPDEGAPAIEAEKNRRYVEAMKAVLPEPWLMAVQLRAQRDEALEMLQAAGLMTAAPAHPTEQ